MIYPFYSRFSLCLEDRIRKYLSHSAQKFTRAKQEHIPGKEAIRLRWCNSVTSSIPFSHPRESTPLEEKGFIFLGFFCLFVFVGRRGLLKRVNFIA